MSNEEFKGIRFCKDCDNILYPRERRSDVANIPPCLEYYCRNCNGVEAVDPRSQTANCVYQSVLGNVETAFVVEKECVSDPTLTRRKGVACPSKQGCPG